MDHFWGKWFGGNKEEKAESGKQTERSYGSESDDDDPWEGARRPGQKAHGYSEEDYSSEESMDDGWSDSDDDDHGGQMMPIPGV